MRPAPRRGFPAGDREADDRLVLVHLDAHRDRSELGRRHGISACSTPLRASQVTCWAACSVKSGANRPAHPRSPWAHWRHAAPAWGSRGRRPGDRSARQRSGVTLRAGRRLPRVSGTAPGLRADARPPSPPRLSGPYRFAAMASRKSGVARAPWPRLAAGVVRARRLRCRRSLQHRPPADSRHHLPRAGHCRCGLARQPVRRIRAPRPAAAPGGDVEVCARCPSWLSAAPWHPASWPSRRPRSPRSVGALVSRLRGRIAGAGVRGASLPARIALVGGGRRASFGVVIALPPSAARAAHRRSAASLVAMRTGRCCALGGRCRRADGRRFWIMGMVGFPVSSPGDQSPKASARQLLRGESVLLLLRRACTWRAVSRRAAMVL